MQQRLFHKQNNTNHREQHIRHLDERCLADTLLQLVSEPRRHKQKRNGNGNHNQAIGRVVPLRELQRGIHEIEHHPDARERGAELVFILKALERVNRQNGAAGNEHALNEARKHQQHSEQPFRHKALLLEHQPAHANLDGLSAEGAAAGKTIVIPVCYGGEFGPDLEHVAQFHDITPEEVVRLHTEPTYLIAMLGFLPGFAYLSGLNPDLETPRLEVPRVRIEAGAVGIGGAQTGIYPLPSPGGWQIIGRSPLRPYDAEREPAFLYAAGDSIKFEAISPVEYAAIEAALQAGTYEYRVKEAK